MSPLALLAVVLVGPGARAEDRPDDRSKTLGAVRVEAAPVIDGRLDDAVWRRAAPEERFTQNFPDEGKPPSQRTELYVVYDDHALYVGLRCHDGDPGHIVEWLTRRDRETAADRVTVDIDSRHDHTSAYHFEVNVSGVLTDGLRYNDGDYSTDWDGLWNAATTRDDTGWTAEIEIPWRTLRFDGHSPVMGFQVRRHIERRAEVDEWAYTPRIENGQVSRYGSLTGIVGLGPKRLIQIQPYAALGLQIRTNSDPATDDGTRFIPNLGIDAKFGLTNSLTLDATINPDFGQVEADQVVLNLSTFEVFYPEKRPFFLEGVDLFATPVQLFYTRRIGRPPSTLNTRDQDTAVDTPLLGRIWGAAKLSGQIVPHLSIAALDAVTAAQDALVQRPSEPDRAQVQLDPLTNFAVLRLRADWGSSFVGITGTAVNRFEQPGAAAPLADDYCPGEFYTPPPESLALRPLGGRCSRDAYAGSVDARIQSSDGTWTFHGQGVASLVEGGPTRVLPDGTRIGSGDGGWGLALRGGKQGGRNFLFSARYEAFSPTLDLNDAGYLRQQNLHFVVGSATLRTTRPIGRMAESNIEAFALSRFAWDGTRIDTGFGIGPWARFTNQWQLWVGGGSTFDRWDNRETQDGAQLERKGGLWAELWLKTDQRQALNGELNLHFHRVPHGYTTQGDLTVGLRPVPQFEVQLIPRWYATWGEPRWAETSAAAAGDRTYTIGDLRSESFDVTLRGIYTFTPRLTFQLYTQVFVAAGHYSNWMSSTVTPATCPGGKNPCPLAQMPLSSFGPAGSKGADDDFAYGDINVNAVLRWEFLPGSTLIAVYSRAQHQTSFDPLLATRAAPSLGPFAHGPAVDNLMLKVTYLWR